MGNLDFDATTVEPMESRDVLAPGDYRLFVKDSEIVATKDGTGKLLKLTMSVDGGAHDKFTFFNRLNLWNKSEDAVKIAKKELSSLCRAINKPQVQNHEDLKFKTFIGTLKVETSADRRYANNTISAYKSIDAPAAVAGAPAKAPW